MARLLVRSRVPGRVSRRQVFERVAARTMATIRSRAQGRLDGVELTIDYVPPASADLCHVFEATAHKPATVVLYYIPLSRLSEPSAWREVIGDVLAEHAALLCGLSADELWPDT